MGVCELCGKNSKLFKTQVEGAVFDVCPDCSKFGKRLAPPDIRSYKPVDANSFKEAEDVQLLVSDYSAIIKSRREKLGLKQEHLAKKMGIKESIIHHVESNKLKLSMDLAKKFERSLGVKLLEKGSE